MLLNSPGFGEAPIQLLLPLAAHAAGQEGGNMPMMEVAAVVAGVAIFCVATRKIAPHVCKLLSLLVGAV